MSRDYQASHWGSTDAWGNPVSLRKEIRRFSSSNKGFARRQKRGYQMAQWKESPKTQSVSWNIVGHFEAQWSPGFLHKNSLLMSLTDMVLMFSWAGLNIRQSLPTSKPLTCLYLEHLLYKLCKCKFFLYLFEMQILITASCQFYIPGLSFSSSWGLPLEKLSSRKRVHLVPNFCGKVGA